mmetsp:Transcript_26089/g.47325  ORF Transcript_26089/g.47325 Transcript_26089/m.47325 type:complete len:202 (-) Transcript_26089:69-674(-)
MKVNNKIGMDLECQGMHSLEITCKECHKVVVLSVAAVILPTYFRLTIANLLSRAKAHFCQEVPLMPVVCHLPCEDSLWKDLEQTCQEQEICSKICSGILLCQLMVHLLQLIQMPKKISSIRRWKDFSLVSDRKSKKNIVVIMGEEVILPLLHLMIWQVMLPLALGEILATQEWGWEQRQQDCPIKCRWVCQWVCRWVRVQK